MKHLKMTIIVKDNLKKVLDQKLELFKCISQSDFELRYSFDRKQHELIYTYSEPCIVNREKPSQKFYKKCLDLYEQFLEDICNICKSKDYIVYKNETMIRENVSNAGFRFIPSIEIVKKEI